MKLKPTIIAIAIALSGLTFIGATKEATPNPSLAVTSIVRWYNDTDSDYYINVPEQNKNFVIPRHQMREGGIFETWIPHVNPPSDFAFGHYIFGHAPNTTLPSWYIWQRNESDGDKVRSAPLPKVPCSPIAGNADVGGNRYGRISASGISLETAP